LNVDWTRLSRLASLPHVDNRHVTNTDKIKK